MRRIRVFLVAVASLLPALSFSAPPAKVTPGRLPRHQFERYERFRVAHKDPEAFMAPFRAAKHLVGAPPLPASGLIDLRNYPMPQDPYPLLQGIVDGLPANAHAVVMLPAGWWVLSHPVIVDKPGIKFIGIDQDVTGFWCFNAPAFVFGNPRGAGMAANWVPSLLDPARFGFVSGGKTVIQLANHPVVLGGKLDPSTGWGNTPDHWANVKGYTINLAFDPMGSQFPLLSSGRFTSQSQSPGVMILPQGNGKSFLTTCYTLADGRTRFSSFLIPSAGLSRVDLGWDFVATKKFTAKLNGVPVVVQGDTDLPVGFQKSKGNYALNFGCDDTPVPVGPKANFALYAAKFSTVYIKDRPNVDSWLFDQSTPGCVTLFTGTKDPDPKGRLVTFLDGNTQRAYGWAFDATKPPNFQAGNALQNVTCWGNPAVVVGDTGDLRLLSCTFGGGLYGVASQSMGISYPFTLRDSTVWGDEAGWNLFFVIMYSIERVTVVHGGNTYARFTGCHGTADGCLMAFVSPNLASDVEHFCLPGVGGPLTWRDSIFDHEGVPASLSVFRVEGTDGNRTSLDVSNINAANISASASVIRLEPVPNQTPSALRAFGYNAAGGAYSVYVGGPMWRGESTFLGSLPVGGPNAANVIAK